MYSEVRSDRGDTTIPADRRSKGDGCMSALAGVFAPEFVFDLDDVGDFFDEPVSNDPGFRSIARYRVISGWQSLT